MATGKGKDFLLKVYDGAAYTTVGGLRSSSFKGSAEAIDITSIDSTQWAELLDAAGIRKVGLSGAGILKSDAPVSTLRSAWLNQTLTNFQLVEVGGTWAGSFKITAWELTGEYNGAQTYSLSLESSGEVTFT